MVLYHQPICVSVQVSIDEVDEVMGAANIAFLDLLHTVIAKGITPLFAVPDLSPNVIGYGKELSLLAEVLTLSSPSHSAHVPECEPRLVLSDARCSRTLPLALPSSTRRVGSSATVPSPCLFACVCSLVHSAIVYVFPSPCVRVTCRRTARPLLVSGARGCGMTFFGTVLAHRVRHTPGAFPGGIALVSTVSGSADPRVPLLAVCSAFRIGATEVRIPCSRQHRPSIASVELFFCA
jgi:hypothetical protein